MYILITVPRVFKNKKIHFDVVLSLAGRPCEKGFVALVFKWV